jgi:hypothetical protein
MEEKSSYIFEIESASTNTSPTTTFADEDRFIRFNSSRCCKYYFIEILASILGPFAGLVAVPAWGKKGAQSMMYLPKGKSGYAFLFVSTVSAVFSVIPLLELVFVLSGVRSHSNFSVGAEGFLLVFCLFLAPFGSAIKYGFMSQRRFEEKILRSLNNQNRKQLEKNGKGKGKGSRSGSDVAPSFDPTADSMSAWASTLKDDLLERELSLAMWRSGSFSDGTMQFSVISNACTDGGDDEIATLKQVSLVSVLRAIIDRHRKPRLSRPMRLRIISILFPFAPFALVPSLWRVFALDKPFFGSDHFEIAACVLAFLSNLQYVHWFFWAMFHTTGHLNRAQDIANEYNKLLVPSFEEEEENSVIGGGNNRNSSSSTGSSSAAVVVLATTAHNVKVWERGRRALLLFGQLYWLRMSWITATTAAFSSLLLTIVVIQLILSLLRGSSMQITSFVLMVSMLILFNSSAFAFVVIAGMKTMRKRREHRTNVLRRSVMMTTKNNSEVSAELRHLALLLESELESHKIRMLGLPLNSRMLESLFGGVVAIVLVFYQVVNSAGSGVSIK